jgi:hypothetical protein
MDDAILSLFGHLLAQSLMAIGGIYVVVAELQRVVVVENGWIGALNSTTCCSRLLPWSVKPVGASWGNAITTCNSWAAQRCTSAGSPK